MKRSRHPSSSEESDNGSNSTSWSQHSIPRRANGKKPSEVFRTDFITAMKLHDTYQLNPEDYYVLVDPWRQEWEKGVQVPVSPDTISQPVARVMAEKGTEVMFSRPKKLIRSGGSESLGYVDIQTLAEGTCRYDLNETDMAWLELVNHQFTQMGMDLLNETVMERVMEEFERRCYDGMTHAMATEEGLGIEYDEDVVCDVCRSPDSEDNNEMVFCDKCNICVHQACYGILKVPEGSWLCRPCALGIAPKCHLCPKNGGAMKPTRSGTKWVHVSCALWIPEVSIGNPEKMEPITNMSQIPSNRWALTCCLCKDITGACIQCSAKSCRTAFHVSCALHSVLEMNTILTERDEVKFKAFCPEHSGPEGGKEEPEEEDRDRDKKGKRRGRVRGDEVAPLHAPTTPDPVLDSQGPGAVNQDVSLRQIKLQRLEEEFHQFVDATDVASRLRLSPESVDFLYQYWKLKRRANHNQPLLTPQKEEEDSLARREHDVLLRRLQLFTHLRQDLERVRNLTYMVTRREKMKRTLWRVQEQIFTRHVLLLDKEVATGVSSTGCLNGVVSPSLVSSPRTVWGFSGLKTRKRDGGKGGLRKGDADRHAKLRTESSDSDRHAKLRTESSDPDRHAKLRTESSDSDRHAKLRTESTDWDRHAKLRTESSDPDRHAKLRTESSDSDRHAKLRTESSDSDRHAKLRTESSDPDRHAKLRTVSTHSDRHAKLRTESSDSDSHAKLRTESSDSDRHAKLNTDRDMDRSIRLGAKEGEGLSPPGSGAEEGHKRSGGIEGEVCTRLEVKEGKVRTRLGVKEGEVRTRLGVKEGEVRTRLGVKEGEVRTRLGVKEGEVCTRLGVKEGEVCTRLGVKEGEVCTRLGVKAGEVRTRLGVKEGEVCTRLGVKAGEVHTSLGATEREVCTLLGVKEGEAYTRLRVKEGEGLSRLGSSKGEGCTRLGSSVGEGRTRLGGRRSLREPGPGSTSSDLEQLENRTGSEEKKIRDRGCRVESSSNETKNRLKFRKNEKPADRVRVADHVTSATIRVSDRVTSARVKVTGTTDAIAKATDHVTGGKPTNRMSEARVRLTRVKVHNVSDARVRLTRVKVGEHLTEVKDRRERPSGRGDSQSDPGDAAVSMTTKPNGWLSSGRAVSRLKNWGKFRIPKRKESHEEEAPSPGAPPRKPPHKTPPKTSEPSYPRTRLRTGTETDGYASPKSKSLPTGTDMEACLKRCHTHTLSDGAYGSDIIHHGVLAS